MARAWPARPVLVRICLALVVGVVSAPQAVWADGSPAKPAAKAEPAAQAVPAEPDVVETVGDEPPAGRPTPAPSAGGDVIEPIAGQASIAPVASPPPADKIELHGWARQSIEINNSKTAFYDAEPDPVALRYDALVSRTQLFVRARYAHQRWLEIDASGFISYSFFEQTPDQRSTTFDGFNGQATRGTFEPTLHELYVALYGKQVDFRLGAQRVAWGRADFVSPNDVLNARDTRDPFVSETETRTIPALLARADIDLTAATLELIYQPLFTPDRFDVYGSNWAVIQPDAPVWLRGVTNVIASSVDPTQQGAAQTLLQSTQLPSGDGSAPVVGAKLAWSAGGVDVDHYYQYGFDGPRVAVDPALAGALGGVDWGHAGLTTLQPLLQAMDAGQHPLRVDYVRRHHIGLDATAPAGPFVVRLDAAYDTQRVFYRQDLTSTISPALQAVLSLEYQTGNVDNTLIVEETYLHAFDETGPLLIYDHDTLATALDARFKVRGPFSVELRAVLGERPVTAIVQPQVDFGVDPFVLSLGGLWLGGESGSFGDYFHRNREIYFKAKWLF